MSTKRELLLEERDGHLFLGAPEVGTFTCAVPKGRIATPGADAGVIRTLARRTYLTFPPGAAGRIVNAVPERVHEPVGFGDVLYELAPVEGGEIVPHAEAGGPGATAGNVFPSAHAGRFWHRAAPGEPPLVAEGAVISVDDPIGLIEVMKTFGRVLYQPGEALPARARVVRVLAADGAEVHPGDALLEIEPA